MKENIISAIQVVFGYLVMSSLLRLLFWFIPIFHYFFLAFCVAVLIFRISPYMHSNSPFAFRLEFRFLQSRT